MVRGDGRVLSGSVLFRQDLEDWVAFGTVIFDILYLLRHHLFSQDYRDILVLNELTFTHPEYLSP